MVPGEHREKMKSKWKSGVWLGKSTDSNEHLIGTPDGVERVRTVRRKVTEEMWNVQEVNSMIGTPWDLKGLAEKRNRDASVGVASSGQRMKWTPTPGCRGCEDSHRYHHTVACKLRKKEFNEGVGQTMMRPGDLDLGDDSIVDPIDVLRDEL